MYCTNVEVKVALPYTVWWWCCGCCALFSIYNTTVDNLNLGQVSLGCGKSVNKTEHKKYSDTQRGGGGVVVGGGVVYSDYSTQPV